MQIRISNPSDLPDEHRDIISRTIRRWNTQHSRYYGIHYSSTDSEEGGAPGFGEYAQDVLNKQIVDESDMVLAIFTDRLGTPTPTYESGTAEEIDRGLAQGKDVAVLQNDCPRKPIRSVEGDQQRTALNQYVDKIRPKAFIAQYESTSRLAEIVDQLLSTLARKYRNESNAGRTGAVGGDESVLVDAASIAQAAEDERGIWPRVEVDAGSKDWYLVLESSLPYSARNVRFTYTDQEGNASEDFDLFANRHRPVDSLPPRGTVRFKILQAMGSPDMALCVVEWEDPSGNTHSTRSTVRTVQWATYAAERDMQIPTSLRRAAGG